MGPYKSVELMVDCYAAIVPQGTPIILAKGTSVEITQSRGGQVTAVAGGHMVRISAEDAKAALGAAYVEPETIDLPEGAGLKDWAWALMRTCYDPEISVNIVDLGLIYDCEETEVEPGVFRLHVMMTLTAPGCGMGPLMIEDIKQKLMGLDQVKDVQVELVFDPPWDQSRMSEAARLELGLL